jgi:DNA repair exonuclease SbcCD ATPase subunit
MPSRLPANTKSLVIQQWLKGDQRDKIAADSGLSAGAVTNIINEWKQGLGFAVADELRELAVTLKKIGITPVQCAVGFRVAATMNRLGVKEEEFESFMINVFSRCKNLGLTPESIASYLTDLLEFSKSIPITRIPDYIKSKKEEKEKLEKEIESIHDQIADFEAQRSVSRDLLDIALNDEKMTTAKLKWYSDIKEELAKHGIPVDDISKLANVINGIRQQGFDANKVMDEFSNLNMLRTECNMYQDNIPRLKVQYDTLNQSYLFLQQEVSSHNQSITAYRELEAMGFGLKELKLLWHTINEITDANNIPPYESVQKFLRDIEEQYKKYSL